MNKAKIIKRRGDDLTTTLTLHNVAPTSCDVTKREQASVNIFAKQLIDKCQKGT